MARAINTIVIHCSATPNGDTLFRGTRAIIPPVQVIDEMHRQRGFKRGAQWRAKQNPALTSIGYHFVIYTRGAVATGRHLDEVGAHVLGYNANSIGICLLGTDAFSRAQWDSLRDHLCGFARYVEAQQVPPPRRFADPTPAEALAIFAQQGVRVVGHRELSPDKNGDGTIDKYDWLKICPGFDVQRWLKGGMVALSDHLILDPAEGVVA